MAQINHTIKLKNMNVGFKITVEYTCADMMDVEEFERAFKNDALEAYKAISDDFKDSPLNFSDSEKVVKVEPITFKCKGCGHELPENFQMKTKGYCYMCDPEVTVKELLNL
jgi:hypothetical protein